MTVISTDTDDDDDFKLNAVWILKRNTVKRRLFGETDSDNGESDAADNAKTKRRRILSNSSSSTDDNEQIAV